MKMLHRGEKGFTLIELLVVIAILGVIAAVVALNVAGFFGEGTLQAANTELHQAQTAIVSAMATVESSNITVAGTAWAGQPNYVVAHGANNATADASDFCYGPFRAAYTVSTNATTIGAITFGDPDIDGGWGPSISWNSTYMNWQAV
jgi:prepilin-type N-terminal cleavage/methylation domain-containing protein